MRPGPWDHCVSPPEISRSTLVSQLHALGVREGGVLLVHTSFRAVRPVEGGIAGLIDGLVAALGPEGTLVMPSWTGDDESPFDPASTPSAEDLGAVPQVFWRIPGVLRSDHLQAFAAVGPAAEAILRDPLPLPPHIPASPVGRVHDLDGQILLLGVGHEANTTIHLAELLADVPYRVTRECTVLRNGAPHRITYGENDCCGERFSLVDDWLRSAALQHEGMIGHAYARLMRSRDLIGAVLPRLLAAPLLFLHEVEVGCEDCDLARESVLSGPHS